MAKMSTDDLIEAFKELSLIELSEFVKKFEEVFEVTAAAPVAVAAAAAAACRHAQHSHCITPAAHLWWLQLLLLLPTAAIPSCLLHGCQAKARPNLQLLILPCTLGSLCCCLSPHQHRRGHHSCKRLVLVSQRPFGNSAGTRNGGRRAACGLADATADDGCRRLAAACCCCCQRPWRWPCRGWQYAAAGWCCSWGWQYGCCRGRQCWWRQHACNRGRPCRTTAGKHSNQPGVS